LPAKFVFARWTGSFQGKAFALAVSFDPSAFDSPSALANLTLIFHIHGSYGSQAVKGIVSGSESDPNSLRFSGTIGHHHVAGTVTPVKHGATNKATATFTVTG
jgi:hypothetical protein